MFRSILGFAILAVAVWLTLPIVFGLMGTLIGLVVSVLWLAAIGYVLYLVLRVVSPNSAARVRETIRRWPRTIV